MWKSKACLRPLSSSSSSPSSTLEAEAVLGDVLLVRHLPTVDVGHLGTDDRSDGDSDRLQLVVQTGRTEKMIVVRDEWVPCCVTMEGDVTREKE